MKRSALLVALLLVLSVFAWAAYSGGTAMTTGGQAKTQPKYVPPKPEPRPEPGPRPAQQPPAEEAKEKLGVDESRFKCHTQGSIVDRIKCRLRLSDEELSETTPGGETEIYFMPEECRPLADEARGRCVSQYAKVQTCWRFEGSLRGDCIKKRVGLPENSTVRDEKAKCAGRGDACREQLRQKVLSLVKFRFYGLEDKAAQLLRKGVSEQVVADFIAGMEQKKQDFNAAPSPEARKQVVREAAKLWKNFKLEAYKELKG